METLCDDCDCVTYDTADGMTETLCDDCADAGSHGEREKNSDQ